MRTGGNVYVLKAPRDGRPGTYRLVFYDHRGRRRFKQLRAASLTDAWEVHRHLSARSLLEQVGARVPAERMTLADYWDTVYFPDCEAGAVSEETAKKKRDVFEAHLRPMLGGVPLSELRTEAVHQAYRKMRNRHPRQRRTKLAEATVYYVDRVLTSCVHHAADRGYFGERAERDKRRGQWVKPWKSPKKPRSKKRDSVWSMEDLARIVNVARKVGGLRLAVATMLALIAGHRRGEQAALRLWRDLHRHPDGSWDVRVHATKTGEDGLAVIAGAPARLLDAYVAELSLDFPHDPASAGGFPLFPRTRSRTYWVADGQGRKRERRTDDAGGEVSGYVVTDRQWERVKFLVPLPTTFRFHDLRGAYAKILGQHLSPVEVQKAMRHSRWETTELYLAAKRDPAAIRAAEVFAKLPLEEEGERSRCKA